MLSQHDEDFDAETRWAVQWFERYGFDEGPYGEAEKLFTATATSLDGLRRAGIVDTKPPKVWLIDPERLPADWDPVADTRTPLWEVTMHLLRALLHGAGEAGAAALLARVGAWVTGHGALAYRLADVCERRQWAQLALDVNALVASWPEIARQASAGPAPAQDRLL